MSTHELDVKRLARVLSEISHTLESLDDRTRRVERALTLAGEIVPARRCALLEMAAGETVLYGSPVVAESDRTALTAKLGALYRLVAGGDEIGRSSDALPSLALPVMGLDQIIGVIRVEPADDMVHDARHLRLLSVVAAQLGSYLAMVRLRERDAARTRELTAAHDFQRLLAGVVSHDLRNPLAVITTVASNLLAKTTDETQVRALERALRNAEHATKLISDLVDVTASRVSGTIRVSPQAADFVSIVRDTVGDLRQAHGTRTIELSVAGAPPIDGSCDPDRVKQIVTNLVNNAVVHGEPSLPIAVRLAAVDDTVTLTVHNWGAPIEPALLPAIFDPFKQGAPKQRPHDVRGLGLGLYIVDCLVRGHGGDVTVSSNAETGTVFAVRLPRHAATPKARPQPSVDVGESATVMVVDDDEDIRVAMEGLLGQRGYHVALAVDGLDGMRQLRAGLRPQLILLDYSMPVMNGEAFCEACSRDPELAAIPIVVVSSDTAAAVRLAHTQARAFLQKPVSIDRLLEAIRQAR
ncbi:MAG: hybrid sensor histidine kinase/response regulator [Deltaproteobacteria bacterium]|nr:hybrid sensor histidine kinase/response regulator [Deltaproteobacteria bacterium]MDQ3296919.1 ATP-binding protein [Myxococcota bacterium]